MDADTKNRLAQRIQLCVGNNVRAERANRKMTQEQLAIAAGLAARHVQKLEAGDVNITLRSLAALAHALSVPAAVLLSDMKKGN